MIKEKIRQDGKAPVLIGIVLLSLVFYVPIYLTRPSETIEASKESVVVQEEVASEQGQAVAKSSQVSRQKQSPKTLKDSSAKGKKAKSLRPQSFERFGYEPPKEPPKKTFSQKLKSWVSDLAKYIDKNSPF